MSTYLFSALTVASNLLLPELPNTDDDKGDILFTLEQDREQADRIDWFHHWLVRNEQVLSYGRRADHHLLRFGGLADFSISDNANEISCYPTPETPQETLRHLFLDQVLPRCLAHQGRIMLHASAVQLEHGLILFIGESGAGKSTLAGDFHRAGNPAISDDCVWLKENGDEIVAIPTYGGLRLWDDSLEVLFDAQLETHSMAHYSSKKRVPLQEDGRLQASEGIPVLAVIMLSPPGETSASAITLERLPNREAFIAVLKQTFQLNVRDLERMARHIEALGRIVPRLPAFRLSMPHDYDLLPTVRLKIMDAIL